VAVEPTNEPGRGTNAPRCVLAHSVAADLDVAILACMCAELSIAISTTLSETTFALIASID